MVHRKGLKDAKRVAAIKDAYEGGALHVKEIAREFRISTASIARLVRDCGWKRRPQSKFARQSGYHKPATIALDAREKFDDREVLEAKKLLQRRGWVAYGKDPYMVGTRWLDRDGLLAKAARYGASQ